MNHSPHCLLSVAGTLFRTLSTVEEKCPKTYKLNKTTLLLQACICRAPEIFYKSLLTPHICGLQLLVLTFSFSTLEIFIFVTEKLIFCNRSQHFVFHPVPAKFQLSIGWISPQEGVRDMHPVSLHGTS